MNLRRVGDELGRSGRLRAHYRDPNDAGVSALSHRDLRIAIGGARELLATIR